MIFVDANVIMYAVGRPHPLKDAAREFFNEAGRTGARLFTSAEVLQEMAHVYLPSGRSRNFDAAVELIARAEIEVWPLEEADVALARDLFKRHPDLQTRDLCHLASCRRRDIHEIKTYDRAFAAITP